MPEDEPVPYVPTEKPGTPESEELHLGSLSIYGNRALLFAALAKAQAGYDPIKRTRTVQVRGDKASYDYDYAPLEEVISCTLPSLNANGLAWTSLLADPDTTEATDLHTMLTHESGAFLHVKETLPPVQKAQERGIQVTYRRRYQYQCVTGTSPEFDDDGGSTPDAQVSNVQQKRREPPKPPPVKEAPPASQERIVPTPSKPVTAPKATDTLVDVPEKCSDPTSARIRDLMRSYGIRHKLQAEELCVEVTGVKPEAITEKQGQALVGWLEDACTKKGIAL